MALVTKSKTMTFNPAPGHPESVFTMRGVQLQAVQTFKYLGIYFHQDCTWNDHIQYVRGRMNKAVGMWLPVLQCHYLPASVRIGLAYTFVYTHALYGAEAWAAPRNELAKMDAISKAAPRVVFGLHQFDCHAVILFADCGLLPVSALISAAKQCWKVRLPDMSAKRFPVAVDFVTIPGQIGAACKKDEDFNARINTICNDIHKFYGMKIVTRAPAERPTRCSAHLRSNRIATVDDQTDAITFCALTRRRIVSTLWQVFLQKQLEVQEGKVKVLATWICDVITHDRGGRAPFIDVVAPGYAVTKE